MELPDLKARLFSFLQGKSRLFSIFLLCFIFLFLCGGYLYLRLAKEEQVFQEKRIQSLVVTSGGSRHLAGEETPGENLIGFWGRIEEKGEDFLLVKGGKETKKVNITSQTKYRRLSRTPDEKVYTPVQAMVESLGKVKIDFKDIKIGNIVDIVGIPEGEEIEALSVVVDDLTIE